MSPGRRTALAPVLGVLFVTILAGCTTGPGTQQAPDIEWTTLDVDTEAVEPWEFQGFIRIGWAGDLFAIDSEVEPDLPRYLVRDGDTVYTSRQGIGWTSWRIDQAVGDGEISNRLVLWDLRRLVDDDRLQQDTVPGEQTRIQIHGTLQHARAPLPLTAEIVLEEDRLVAAEVVSAKGRESPFRFTPSQDPLSFKVRVPEESRPESEVQELDAAARRGHVAVIGLLQDYAERRGGQLPERIDQETLSLEATLSGTSWPTNPYTGRPLGEGDGSGDIRWKRCTTRTGMYMGLGWDLSVVGESFGGNCAFTAG